MRALVWPLPRQMLGSEALESLPVVEKLAEYVADARRLRRRRRRRLQRGRCLDGCTSAAAEATAAAAAATINLVAVVGYVAP
jgi:hypothetical protein